MDFEPRKVEKGLFGVWKSEYLTIFSQSFTRKEIEVDYYSEFFRKMPYSLEPIHSSFPLFGKILSS